MQDKRLYSENLQEDSLRDEDERVCKICYDEASLRDDLDNWVQPCKCLGSMRWVHKSCMLVWIKTASYDQQIRCALCGYCYQRRWSLKKSSQRFWPELDITLWDLAGIIWDLIFTVNFVQRIVDFVQEPGLSIEFLIEIFLWVQIVYERKKNFYKEKFLAIIFCIVELNILNAKQAVYKWYRRQSSDSDTAIPYIFATVGSLLWLRYSIFIQDLKLILLQSYAVIMQTFFLLAMLFYRSKKRRLMRITIAVFVGIFSLFLFIAHLPTSIGLQVSGICASGAQIAGSFVCPYLIWKAFSSKIIDFIPFAPVAFTWVMELHAIVYSVGIHDFYLLSANAIFFCMDGCLLAMFFIFPTERKVKENGTNFGHNTKVSVL